MLHVQVPKAARAERPPRAAPDDAGRDGGRATRRAGPPILVGAAVAAAVVALRYSGLLVGPVAVVAAVASVLLLPRPRQLAERFIVAFAVLLGWLPLLGWVPGIGTTVDVPGIVLGIVAGLACGGRLWLRRAGATTAAGATVPEAIAVLVGAATALWWAVPYTSLGLTGRLQYLFNAYDNATHFDMFRANLTLGSFVAVRRHLPGGALRLAWDYPQGVHQGWAQAVHLWAPHPATGVGSLLDSYAAVLLVTNGLCVVLGCMAVARICRKDLFSALVGMAAVVALFTFGLFGPFNGYPNFDLAVMAGAVAVSLAVRPAMAPGGQFLAVAGLGLAVAYGWYPLLLVVAPALVASAVAFWRGRRPQGRSFASAVLVASVVALAGPATLFLHRGVSTLNTVGGVIGVPWGLLVVSGAALGALVVYRQVAVPDRTTNLVVGAPALLGGGAVVVVVGYELLSKGAVSYYGEKLGAGVFGVCFLVLAWLVADRLAGSELRGGLPRPVVITLALLAGVVALEADGYVGPYPHALAGSDVAAGVASHSVLTSQAATSASAGVVLAAARIAQGPTAGALTEGRGAGWWFVNPGFGVYGFVYGEDGVWFSVLRGDPSQAEYEKITLKVAPRLLHPGSADAVARVISRDFDPASGRLHLFVPTWLRAALVHRDPAWGRPGVLLPLPSPAG